MRAAQIADARKLVDRAEAEKRELTSEENAEWEKRMTDVDACEGNIKKAERKEKLEALEGEQRAIQPRKTSPHQPAKQITRGERNASLKAWMGYGSPVSSLRYDGETLDRCAGLGMAVNNSSITLRSMNTSTAGAGGAGTFQTYFPDIQSEMKYYSPVLQSCNLQVTDNGNTFTFPRGSDVANTMAIVAQSGASGVATDPTFDKVALGAYTFRYVEQVTYEMLQDAVFDVEGWLTSRLAERAGRTVEKYIVSGTGSAQPTGLTTAAIAADGGTAAVTLAATKKNFTSFDDLMTLFSAVDLSYRSSNTLLLHDSSVWDLRKIKDTQGRYVWDVNNTLVQNAQPDKIAGFNYLISNSIDASGAFNKNIGVFANLSRHVVRMVDGIQITRLNEIYRGNGMIGFEILMRFDSNYVGHASSIARALTPAA
jgi:HK97 family phage major capsid protein